MDQLAIGAALSSAFQVLFDRLASIEFLNLFRGQKHDESLVNNLKLKLEVLNTGIDDAETKQFANQAVKKWLDELKDVVYKADDLLDKINYEDLQRKLEAEHQSGTDQVRVSILTSITRLGKRKFHEMFSTSLFDEETQSKLEEISNRLEDLAKQKDVLGLRETVGWKLSHGVPSTSLEPESGVYGRENDKEKIIELLLSDEASGNGIGVIPIVGMGGVGKTTLAQLVYNDGRVDKHFDLKAWVCITDKLDVFSATKSILEKITRINSTTTDLDQLQVSLKEQLIGKKFLVVFDDIWNEDYGLWDILKRPFMHGVSGSKIIATTRNQSVASVVQTVPVHNLEQLSGEDCWALFAKIAFSQEDSSAHPSLEMIGKEIVKRCKGLPLAAKTLGSLLRSKLDVDEWKSILESDLWDLPKGKNNILPALSLSYHYLPSHLKQCFAFSSIYPKNHIFEKDSLVMLWIAQNFVQPRGNTTLKKLGYEYFDELVSRSFFQQARRSGSSFGMHDLVHDLAQVLSGEFSFRLEDMNKKQYDISSKVRHFSYIKGTTVDTEMIKATNEVKHSRTFLSLGSKHATYGECNMVLNVLPTLPYLRVLSLPKFMIMELPDWIGTMIHLRYLDLSHSYIKQLPKSVCSLYNLQTLLLSNCRNLTALPIDIGKLICLHHLDITGTSLMEMPMQISRLTCLQQLTAFVVGKPSDSGLGVNGLEDLRELHGKLSILNLQNVTSGGDALNAKLKEKNHLGELELEWGGEINDLQNERVVVQNLQREVLENLQPHTNLKRFAIKNYGGIELPSWLGDPSFSSIVSLSLSKCKYCFSLPPLGQLYSLKELTISEMNEIREVAPHFYGDVSLVKPFPSLVRLSFKNMLKWEKWCMLGREEFSRLQTLSVHNCLKLRDLPTHIPSLMKLDIQDCPKLKPFPPLGVFPNLRRLKIQKFSKFVTLSIPDEHGIRNPTSLEHVDIWSCPNLVSISQGGLPSPNLKYFQVMNCKKLKLLPEGMQSLEELHIYGCPKIKSFPERGLPSNLRKLTIQNCEKLKALPEGMPSSLRELSIENCPEIESIPEGGLPSDLHSLSIMKCKKLKGLLEQLLRTLPSLDSLKITNYPEGVLLSNLHILHISHCKKLKPLPEQMHTLLPSLEKLKISYCPEIESFPEGNLPSKLREICISNCNELVAHRREWSIQTLSSLERFEIRQEEGVMASFPDEGLLPSTLTSLSICCLRNLKSLNKEGLQPLRSLKTLWISSCRQLESLPEEPLPASLNELVISDCPLLKPRCQRENGEDWHKIAHIPDIRINHVAI